MKLELKITIILALGFILGGNAQTNFTSGQTKFTNPNGRTILIERDNKDPWLSFHDPGNYWYSMGIDRSKSGIFSLNSGSSLTGSQFVMNSSGDIGLGTSNPTGRLHVKGDVRVDGGWLRVTGTKGVRFNSYGGGLFMKDDTWIRIYGDKSFYQKSGILRTDGMLQVGQSGDRFVVSLGGNVGIGTNDTKGFKLGVKGKIAAEEVKVAKYTNWADFVFDADYKLPTLKEVEQHIQERGHLKDIPSAEEVAKDGFYLAEMNAKLLQKIEELTLYMIQQNKEIQQLKAKVEKLENQ